MLPFIGENNCIPTSPCPFRTWEWDQQSLQNEIVSQCLNKSFPFDSLRPPPNLFFCFVAYLHKHHPHSPSQLSTPLMPKEACTCMPTGTLKPTAPSPPRLTSYTQSVSKADTRTGSLVFEFPLKCDRSHLTGDTHTWCYRVRARYSASWVMRDCHPHCLSLLQKGKGREWQKKKKTCFILSLPNITEGLKTNFTCGMCGHNSQITEASCSLGWHRPLWACVLSCQVKTCGCLRRRGLQSFRKMCWSQFTNWCGFVIGLSIDFTGGNNEITNWMCPCGKYLWKWTKHRLTTP